MSQGMALTYVRWQRDESRLCTTFPKLQADHHQAEAPCPLCQQRLGSWAPVQLVAAGPDNSEDFGKYQAGRWFSCLAIVVHEGCIRTVNEEELENFVSNWLQARAIGPILGEP